MSAETRTATLVRDLFDRYAPDTSSETRDHVLALIHKDEIAREARSAASVKGAATRKRDADMAHAAWKAEANRIWLAHIGLASQVVAHRIRQSLAANAKLGERVPSVRRVQDVVKPVRAIAMKTLERAYARKV